MKFLIQRRLQKPEAGHAFAQNVCLYLIILLLIFPTVNLMAQKLSVMPENPAPGDSLKIIYNPAGGALEKQEDISCSAILFTDLIGDRITIPLKKDQGLFTGTFTLPKNSEFIAIKFYNGVIKDEKSITYQFPLVSNREFVVGAKYAQANLLMDDRYLSFYGFSKEDYASAFALLKQEKRTSIEDPKQVSITREFYKSWLKVDSVNAAKDLLAYVNKLEQQPKTEKNYILSFWLYRIWNKQAQSQQQLADLEKTYPNSLMFFTKRYAEIGSVKSGKTAEDLFLKLTADYSYNAESKKIISDFLMLFYRKISKAYGYDFNLPKFYEYLNKDTSNLYKGANANDVASYLSSKNMMLSEAEKMSEQSLKFLDLALKESPLETSLAALKMTIARSKDTYGLILLQNGKYPIALKLLKVAFDESAGKDPNIQIHYAIALAKNKDFAKALPFLETALKDGNTEELLQESYKEALFAAGGNQESYERKINEMFEIAKSNHKFIMKKNMVDEIAPNTSLLDLNGKKVSLADYKGKTIVVDLWATWCIPCKQSFPGMQKLVEKYAGKNVVFLFINTLEKNRTELNKEIKDYLKVNKYTFNVLLDQPLKDNVAVYDMFSSLNLKSIPTKLVIDKTGKIRFKSTGYLGSDDALIKELSEQIDEVNR